MQVLKKIIIISAMIIFAIMVLKQNVYASGLSGSSIWSKAQGFISKGGQGKISQSVAEQDLQAIGNILFGIAILVLLVVGSIMGVKFMISGADERANMKQKLVWYVVSAVLIFSAAGVFNIVYNVIKTATN